MPFAASFAMKIASSLGKKYLVLDPLVAFRIRCDQYRPFILADFQIVQLRLFGSDSTSCFRGGWLSPVGRNQGLSLHGIGAPGLRPPYRSVVCRVDNVKPALVPYEPALALQV